MVATFLSCFCGIFPTWSPLLLILVYPDSVTSPWNRRSTCNCKILPPSIAKHRERLTSGRGRSSEHGSGWCVLSTQIQDTVLSMHSHWFAIFITALSDKDDCQTGPLPSLVLGLFIRLPRVPYSVRRSKTACQQGLRKKIMFGGFVFIFVLTFYNDLCLSFQSIELPSG